MNFVDLKGKKFNKLVVLSFAGIKNHSAMWLCQCECGNKKILKGSKVSSGEIKSCGCYRKSILLHIKHNLSNSRIYNTYNSMIKRCYKQNAKNYKNYGGRGIKVCEEWKHSFMAFYEWAITNGYNDTLTIDRIDVNGDYMPSNCRWVTNYVQFRNKTNNIYITINNETHILNDWSKISGVSYQTIKGRLERGISGINLLKPTYAMLKKRK